MEKKATVIRLRLGEVFKEQGFDVDKVREATGLSRQEVSNLLSKDIISPKTREGINYATLVKLYDGLGIRHSDFKEWCMMTSHLKRENKKGVHW